MIKSLYIKNFTVFSDTFLDFGQNLNIFVGENGTGKSHLLKLAYSLLAVAAHGKQDSHEDTPERAYLEGAIARKLLGVFRPDMLGRLTRRRTSVQHCDVRLVGDDPKLEITLNFATKDKSTVSLDTVPKSWVDQPPVFLPTRELLTIYPGFVSLYSNTMLPFEETWRDTCLLLGAPLARGPREKTIGKLLSPLEQALGGKITLDETSGKFNLKRGGADTEMHLVAEGLRKLAMVARLTATGTLLDKGCLFWDEPEANLNPKLIKVTAGVIADLSLNGIQVFVATHSLFLLRELHLLQKERELKTKCFGLSLTDDNTVSLETGDDMDEIGTITALDEELLQSDRYLEQETAIGEMP